MAELSYRRHRFPPVVFRHAVWLYLRFTLSYRDVEDLLAERGLDISYGTVRSLSAEVRTGDRATATTASSAAERHGIWTRWGSGSPASGCICGGRSITRARCSTCWSSPGDSRAALRLMRKLLKKQGFAPEIAGARQAALLCLGLPAIRG